MLPATQVAVKNLRPHDWPPGKGLAQILTKSQEAMARVQRSPALVGLRTHVVGNILDVVGAQALPERWHRAVPVGHLFDDGLDFVLAVLLECLLLQLLFGDHRVVATGMASGAVSLEDALSVFQISGHGGRSAARHHCHKKAQGYTERQGVQERLRSLRRRIMLNSVIADAVRQLRWRLRLDGSRAGRHEGLRDADSTCRNTSLGEKTHGGCRQRTYASKGNR